MPPEKFKACVKKVKKSDKERYGYEKYNPYAVCRVSTGFYGSTREKKKRKWLTLAYKISKSKHSAFVESERELTKNAFGIQKRIRQKDELVDYNNRTGFVRKVTKKGIYVEFLKVGKDEIAYPSGKLTFISNKKADKMYPTLTPNYMIADLIA